MNISDQVAVATGAGVGTGRATGERLVARGAAVALTDVDPERGAETLRAIRAGGGGHVPPHFPAAEPDQWSAILDLNLRAPLLATSCLAHLRDSHPVRVNCVAPDWVATERTLREVAALDPDERAGLAPLIGLDRLCDEVVGLIEDDTAAGRVVVLARPEGGDG